MRVLRKLLVVTIAASAVMAALPAMASADPANRAWLDAGDYLGYHSDYNDHAVVEISGTLDMDMPWSGPMGCDVTGEIEIWNHWPTGTPDPSHNSPTSTLDTPARNKLTSLEVVDSPGACSGMEQCPVPGPMTFNDLPWSGTTKAGGSFGSLSSFNDVDIDWCAGSGFPYGTEGTLRLQPRASDYCFEGFDVYVQSTLDLYPYWTPSGSFEIVGYEGLNPDYPCLGLE